MNDKTMKRAEQHLPAPVAWAVPVDLVPVRLVWVCLGGWSRTALWAVTWGVLRVQACRPSAKAESVVSPDGSLQQSRSRFWNARVSCTTFT